MTTPTPPPIIELPRLGSGCTEGPSTEENDRQARIAERRRLRLAREAKGAITLKIISLFFGLILLLCFSGWISARNKMESKQRALVRAADAALLAARPKTPGQIRREMIQIRRDMIESQFSYSDGSHNATVKYLKENLKDPDSLKIAKTVYFEIGEYLQVRTDYRAKNSLGGYTFNSILVQQKPDGSEGEILRHEQNL